MTLAVLRREADVPLVLAVVTGGVRAEEGDISLTRPNVERRLPQADRTDYVESAEDYSAHAIAFFPHVKQGFFIS